MNAKNIIATLGLVTMSLSALASDIDAVVIHTSQGKTRAEVKAELNEAIAKGEIVHGDLADFQQLLASAQQDRMVAQADKKDRRTQDVAKAPAKAAQGDKAP